MAIRATSPSRLFLLSGLAYSLLAQATLATEVPASSEQGIPNTECLDCHGDPDADPRVDPDLFAGSVHGDEQCVSCHMDIEDVDHDTPLAKVDCSECHDDEAEIYLESYHGKALLAGRAMAASCGDCHGAPHAIISAEGPGSPIARANIPDTCARCHGDAEAMKALNLRQLAPIATYTGSVHGLAFSRDNPEAAVCTDCHGSHDLLRSTDPASKLHWTNIPNTCGKCHEKISQTYWRSVHGKAVKDGVKDAPVCTDCHGEHTIAAVKTAASKVYPTRVAETCGECHGAERITTKYRLSDYAVDTYLESYHGLAMRLGSVTAANCSSCHGVHDILPSSDPRSSVNPDNLPTTCGRCHVGVTDKVARGRIHSGTRPGEEHFARAFVRKMYIVLFIVVLGGMLLHNVLDLSRKLRAHFRELKEMGLPHRMSLSQRIQHAVLILSFVTLAYTGFALTFPDAWWASPLTSTRDWRGVGHRVAAIVFCGLCLYHFCFILFTKRGRWEISQLAIRSTDALQFFQMFGYYLGLRKTRPRFGRYSYMEKAEYWALVWGSIIMAVTGSMMTWEEWTLSHFPKWFFDVTTAIHYYEAILACVAVLIWHIYFVVFDPEEYPVKWTFLSGRESRADSERSQEETHPVPEDTGENPS